MKEISVLFVFLQMGGGAPTQLSTKNEIHVKKSWGVSMPSFHSPECMWRSKSCCEISDRKRPFLRLRGGQGTKFVDLVADYPTSAPKDYDDRFPCPQGDAALARSDEALLSGNIALARKLQQEAVHHYNEAFAISKNLDAIEAMEKKIGESPEQWAAMFSRTKIRGGRQSARDGGVVAAAAAADEAERALAAQAAAVDPTPPPPPPYWSVSAALNLTRAQVEALEGWIGRPIIISYHSVPFSESFF